MQQQIARPPRTARWCGEEEVSRGAASVVLKGWGTLPDKSQAEQREIRRLRWSPVTRTITLSQPNYELRHLQQSVPIDSQRATDLRGLSTGITGNCERKVYGKKLMLRSNILNEQSRVSTRTPCLLQFWQISHNSIGIQKKKKKLFQRHW